MISTANSAAIHSAYASKTSESKETKQNVDAAKQGATSRVEELKESIDSGEYKVNIDALSNKMAEELLS